MNKNNTLCILDIETTGFEPEESEIVEIYILKVKDNKVIDEFYSLFKPEKNIKNQTKKKQRIIIWVYRHMLIKNLTGCSNE